MPSIGNRGVSVALVIAGGLLLRAGDSLYQFLFGGLLVVVGFGVWQFRRWARWMALGACFLGVFGAIVFSYQRFLATPPGGFKDQLGVNLVVSAFAFIVAAAGYLGLSYLRSERGRFEFAGDTGSQERLLNERSGAVAISALVWVVLGLMAWYPRQFSPVRLFKTLGPSRMEMRDDGRPKTVFLPLLRQRGTVGAPTTPDLIPLGLCYRDLIRERVIYAALTNAGGNLDLKEFRYGVSPDFSRTPTLLAGTVRAPRRYKMGFVELGLESQVRRGPFLVHLDIGNVIPEKDEWNNTAKYELPRGDEIERTQNLPNCDAVQVLEVPRDGPTITAATVYPPDRFPDLVPLGLCTRGRHSISMQYTNRGSPARGLFVIAQGRSLEQLKARDNVLHSVPETDEARGFSIGTPYDVFGRVGGTYEYFVKLDPYDAFEESNEMNNLVSARFTIRPDGAIDLPDCDALAGQAPDHGWVADDVMLQPAFVTLPDVVPLGFCVKDWGADSRFLQIVYGNIGNVAGHYPMRVDLKDPPQKLGSRYTERFNVPPPGYLGLAQTRRRADDARETEIATVDSRHVISELSETNNKAEFPIPRGPDGSVDLPDCDSVGGRVSDWIGKMNALAGTE